MAETLTPEQVRKVARLARLKLTDEELQRLAPQLSDVLKYIDILSEVDTDDVEPMAHAIEVHNVLRPDEAGPSLPREQALANAPNSDGRYFLVPQIIEGA
ncbi:MAG: Asp-tRNA(Asn)/Glu-tRNA(Gln) amidotransferase subunit GatC [Maioricimonas sp. JB049]